jgi:hypothetical protein
MREHEVVVVAVMVVVVVVEAGGVVRKSQLEPIKLHNTKRAPRPSQVQGATRPHLEVVRFLRGLLPHLGHHGLLPLKVVPAHGCTHTCKHTHKHTHTQVTATCKVQGCILSPACARTAAWRSPPSIAALAA